MEQERNQAERSSVAYRPDVDGLRAVAVLAVVLHHFSAVAVPGGYVGVDVFFVISGFLITGIIAREMAEGRFSFLRFYQRRARRIFPALFAMLGATVAAACVMLLPSDLLPTLRAALGTALFGSNLVFWQMSTGYFDEIETRLNPLLHTWSLAVEEQFYILFPVFLLICYRRFPRHVLAIAVLCSVVSLVGAVLLTRINVQAAFYLAPFRAWELLAGALLALGALPRARSALLREALVGGGMAAIVVACLAYDDSTSFPGLAALVPVLGAVAIIHGGTSGPTIAGRLLRVRPMVYIGLISYSLYLWHWPVVVLAKYANGGIPPAPHRPLLFILCLLLASASYHFVEKPFRRARVDGGSRGIAWVAWASGFAVGASLLYIGALQTEGFPGRFSASVVALDKARAPEIPFQECIERAPRDACRLGHPHGETSILLWGDSHLLAWAPALHEILLQRHMSAVLVVSTGCAPLLELDSQNKPSCGRFSAGVRQYLLDHPHITNVVLSGFWSTYFRERAPLAAVAADGSALAGLSAASRSLELTQQWLRQNRRMTVLIGPVPTYDTNVPATLALQGVSAVVPGTAVEEQRSKNAPFKSAIDRLAPDAGFRVLDPISWMCSGRCEVVRSGIPLYRDAHHLSLAGAMALRAPLEAGLGVAPAASPND